MEKTIAKEYADPTKPVIPAFHKKKSLGWIFFIGFNILFPIAFLVAFLWMRSAN